MRRYGSDKPDLRIALELVDVADLVKHVEFKVFAGPAKDPKGRVARCACRAAAICRASRSTTTGVCRELRREGPRVDQVDDRAKGSEGLQSPIVKFLTTRRSQGILERTGAQDSDLIFFGADSAKVVNDAHRRAAAQGRPRPQARADRLEAPVGRRLPDVRLGRRREALGRHASPVHLAEGRRCGGAEGEARRQRSREPTTSC